MTFDEIVDDVCDRLNLTSPEAVTRVGTKVNRRYRRVTTSIGLRDAFRRVIVTHSVTLSTRIQTVTGVEKVLSVVNSSVTNGTPLTEISYAEMLELVPTSGNPTCWAVKRMGASTVTLIFDSSFATAMNLSVEGEESGTTLSGTQIPAFPESYHDVLVFGALADELRKKEKTILARDAEAEYERILSELRLHIAVSISKDVQQGKQNVSSMAGSGGGSAGPGVFTTLTVNGAASFLGVASFAGLVTFTNFVDSIDFGDVTTSIDLDGVTIGPENFNSYASFPTITVVPATTTGVLRSERTIAPSADGTSDLGYSGTTQRRWRNGIFTGTVAAANLSATSALYERARTAPVGEWTAFTPTRTALVGTWTGGTNLGKYMVVGKTLFVQLSISASSNSNATSQLNIALPGGFTAGASGDNYLNAFLNDGGAATATQGLIGAVAGDTKLFIQLFAGGNFAVNVATLYVRTLLFIPVA